MVGSRQKCSVGSEKWEAEMVILSSAYTPAAYDGISSVASGVQDKVLKMAVSAVANNNGSPGMEPPLRFFTSRMT